MPEKSGRQKKKQRTAAMAEESKAQNSGTKASGQSQQPKLKLEGSCHCQAIKFSLMSSTPCPYTVCFCGFCRKLTGGSGGATFLTGDASTFQAEGTEHLGIYRVMLWRHSALKLSLWTEVADIGCKQGCSIICAAQERGDVRRRGAEPDPGQVTSAEGWRHFCKLCGSHLWTWAPSSPGDINPVASAIDTRYHKTYQKGSTYS